MPFLVQQVSTKFYEVSAKTGEKVEELFCYRIYHEKAKNLIFQMKKKKKKKTTYKMQEMIVKMLNKMKIKSRERKKEDVAVEGKIKKIKFH